MGKSPSKASTSGFDKSLWQLRYEFNNMKVWRHRQKPDLELEEYQLYPKDDAELNYQIAVHQLRKGSKYVVASRYFEKGVVMNRWCSTVYESSLFLERTPIRLYNVREIPFPDALHLYWQAMAGFELLASKSQPFHVDQEHIAITKDGIVKVWLNKDFEKTEPSEKRCSEEDMVRNIIEILQNNIDRKSYGKKPSVMEFIYEQKESVVFSEALALLDEYTKTYNNEEIPIFLNCVRKFGFEALVKRYKENNPNQYKEEGSTMNIPFRQDSATFSQPAEGEGKVQGQRVMTAKKDNEGLVRTELIQNNSQRIQIQPRDQKSGHAFAFPNSPIQATDVNWSIQQYPFRLTQPTPIYKNHFIQIPNQLPPQKSIVPTPFQRIFSPTAKIVTQEELNKRQILMNKPEQNRQTVPLQMRYYSPTYNTQHNANIASQEPSLGKQQGNYDSMKIQVWKDNQQLSRISSVKDFRYRLGASSPMNLQGTSYKLNQSRQENRFVNFQKQPIMY